MAGAMAGAWWPMMAAAIAAGCTRPAAPAAPTAKRAPVASNAAEATLTTARPSSTDAETDAELPALAASVAAMWEMLAVRVGAADRNCAMATAAVADVRVQFADVLTAQQRVIRRDGGDQLDVALDGVAARIAAAVSRLLATPALAHCSENPEFAAAFDRWPNLTQ